MGTGPRRYSTPRCSGADRSSAGPDRLRPRGGQPADPVFDPASKLKVEAAGGVGGEGPAWDPQLGVLTSGNGNIHRLSRDGKSSVHREKAGTNGLLFDREGRLVCCEPVQRRITRIDREGNLTVLTDKFDIANARFRRIFQMFAASAANGPSAQHRPSLLI